MSAQPQQLPVGVQPGIVWGGTDSCTFVNQDPANTVTLGYTNNMTPGALNSIPLAPGSSVTTPQGRAVWACAPPNTAPVIVAPGGLQYIPGRASPSLLDSNSGIADPPGSMYTSPVISTTGFSSYNMEITGYVRPQGNSGAALTFCTLITFYFDAAGQFPMYTERWWGWAGDSLADASPMYGRGPMAGPYMNIQLFVPTGSTQPLYIPHYHIWGNTAPIANSDFRQLLPSGLGNFSLGTQIGSIPGPDFGDDMMLSVMNETLLSAGLTYFRPMPLAQGPVYMLLELTEAPANPLQVFAATYLESSGPLATTPVVWEPASEAGVQYSTTILAPRAPLIMIVGCAVDTIIDFTAIAEAPGA